MLLKSARSQLIPTHTHTHTAHTAQSQTTQGALHTQTSHEISLQGLHWAPRLLFKGMPVCILQHCRCFLPELRKTMQHPCTCQQAPDKPTYRRSVHDALHHDLSKNRPSRVQGAIVRRAATVALLSEALVWFTCFFGTATNAKLMTICHYLSPSSCKAVIFPYLPIQMPALLRTCSVGLKQLAAQQHLVIALAMQATEPANTNLGN